jgi:hypothetical protein
MNVNIIAPLIVLTGLGIICHYIPILIRFLIEGYESKKEFILDLIIPFYLIIRKLIGIFKNLK